MDWVPNMLIGPPPPSSTKPHPIICLHSCLTCFFPSTKPGPLYRSRYLRKKVYRYFSPSDISKCSVSPTLLFAFRYSVDWSQQWLPMNWTLKNITKSVAVLSFTLRVLLNANYVPSMALSVRDSKGNTETWHSGGTQLCRCLELDSPS